MKFIILGGTGVISRSLVSILLENGHDVVAINRGTKKIGFEDKIKTITVDRKDDSAFKNAVQGITSDVVIDMIAFNPSDARQTLEVFRAHTGQIIMTSSIAVYSHPYRSLPIQENKELMLLGSDFAYGQDKANMERYLYEEMQKPGAPITIIRPSLTFGPGARNFGTLRQNYNVVQRIRDGKPLAMIGEGCIPWIFTYVDDLALGYLLCAGNPKTYNDYFQVLSDEMVVWEDLYRFVGEIVGREPILYHVPSSLLKEYDPATCHHLNEEKVKGGIFSTEKFRMAAPDFKPVWKIKDGLAKVIESWEKDNIGIDDAKMAQEDHICSCWEDFRRQLLACRRNG